MASDILELSAISSRMSTVVNDRHQQEGAECTRQDFVNVGVVLVVLSRQEKTTARFGWRSTKATLKGSVPWARKGRTAMYMQAWSRGL